MRVLTATAFALTFATPLMAEPINAIDATGTTVTMAAPASRIACLEFICTVILAALDVQPVALGSGDRELAALPEVFGEATRGIAVIDDNEGFNLEQLAAVQADLIITWGEDAVPRDFLDGTVPIYYVHDTLDADTVADLGLDVLRIGALVGREAEAQAYMDRLGQRFDAYLALAPQPPARVLHIWFSRAFIGEGQAAPCSPITILVAPCANTNTDAWESLTAEGMFALNPDTIMVYTEADTDPGALMAAWADVPLWREIPAVANERVHVIPYGLAGFYTAPSLSHALDTMMPLLYPDTFPAPLTDEQVAAALAQ